MTLKQINYVRKHLAIKALSDSDVRCSLISIVIPVTLSNPILGSLLFINITLYLFV